jgi:hypothetical protein
MEDAGESYLPPQAEQDADEARRQRRWRTLWAGVFDEEADGARTANRAWTFGAWVERPHAPLFQIPHLGWRLLHLWQTHFESDDDVDGRRQRPPLLQLELLVPLTQLRPRGAHYEGDSDDDGGLRLKRSPVLSAPLMHFVTWLPPPAPRPLRLRSLRPEFASVLHYDDFVRQDQLEPRGLPVEYAVGSGDLPDKDEPPKYAQCQLLRA